MSRARSAEERSLQALQPDAVRTLCAWYEEGTRELGLQAPTGFGKTTVLRAVAGHLMRTGGPVCGVVIIAPQDALVESMRQRLDTWLDGCAVFFPARPGGHVLTGDDEAGHVLTGDDLTKLSRAVAWRERRLGHTLLATRQMLCTTRGLAVINALPVGALRGWLFVFDEAHHHRGQRGSVDGNQGGKFVAAVLDKGAAVLSASATPFDGRGGTFRPGTRVHAVSAVDHARSQIVVERTASGRPRRTVNAAPTRWNVVREDVSSVVTKNAEDMIDRGTDRPRGGRVAQTRRAKTEADRVIRLYCEALADRWRRDAFPKLIANVPMRTWADPLREALLAVKPGARIVNLIGDKVTPEDEALLASDAAATRYVDLRVDVVMSCCRMNEGRDWPAATHVYNVRIPHSVQLILQRFGRASRSKHRIAGYAEHAAAVCAGLDEANRWTTDTQTLVLFTPRLSGEEAHAKAWANHRDVAILMATFLADFEEGLRWAAPSGPRDGRGTRRGERAEGEHLSPPRTTHEVGQAAARVVAWAHVRETPPTLEQAVAWARRELRGLPKQDQTRAATLAFLKYSRGARATAARLLGRGWILADRWEDWLALQPALAEHVMVTPANFAPLVATWTAEGAVGATERLREGFGNPPWHDIRHDKEALVRFTLEAMRARGSHPTVVSGACESLGGWTWAALDWALRQVGMCLADAIGRRRMTYAESARRIRAWIDDHGREPSRGSDDPTEQRLGLVLSALRNRAPECCVAEGISLKADQSEAARRRQGKYQFTRLAEVIVMLAREWRATSRTNSIGVKTNNNLAKLLHNAHDCPRQSRGLAHAPDLCQVSSIAAGNAEIEADCWRFTLDGAAEPDPRPWAELLASGDHRRIVAAERVAFLDWKDSRLRGSTRWTDPRTGTAAGRSVCPPAVRRPWAPPETPAAAP